MRLFLGIFPPKEILKSFEGIQKTLKQYEKYLRLVNSSLIHLSLRFLGGFVSKESFEKLQPALRAAITGCEQFNVRIKEVRFGFGGRRWPRILYVSVMKSESLLKLYKSIHEVLDRLKLADIIEDKHRDNPLFHYTLARKKTRLNDEVIRNIRKNLEKVKLWEGFRVRGVSLVSSVLKKEGPEYEVVEKFELRK